MKVQLWNHLGLYWWSFSSVDRLKGFTCSWWMWSCPIVVFLGWPRVNNLREFTDFQNDRWLEPEETLGTHLVRGFLVSSRASQELPLGGSGYREESEGRLRKCFLVRLPSHFPLPPRAAPLWSVLFSLFCMMRILFGKIILFFGGWEGW